MKSQNRRGPIFSSFTAADADATATASAANKTWSFKNNMAAETLEKQKRLTGSGK